MFGCRLERFTLVNKRTTMNIFSFFAGAGFLDLGFELQGDYNVVFVNEFHKAFNYIYQYARASMGIQPPIYGHHVDDITKYVLLFGFGALSSNLVDNGFLGSLTSPINTVLFLDGSSTVCPKELTIQTGAS